MQAKPKAIVLTNGLLNNAEAKTAHGLIRGTERYDITGVIDSVYKGKDAGEKNIIIYLVDLFQFVFSAKYL